MIILKEKKRIAEDQITLQNFLKYYNKAKIDHIEYYPYGHSMGKGTAYVEIQGAKLSVSGAFITIAGISSTLLFNASEVAYVSYLDNTNFHIFMKNKGKIIIIFQ